MKKHLITSICILFSLEMFAFCAEDTRSLTEMLMNRKSPVFYGTVISSTDDNGNWSATIKVIDSFFDLQKLETLTIETGSLNSSTGGSLLHIGTTWLIYDGFSICSRFTKEADSSAKFIAELEMLRQFEALIMNKKSKKISLTNSDGNLLVKGYFKKGKPQGVWEHFFEDGTLKTKETYNSGVLNGTYITYNSKGKILKEFLYIKGKVATFSIHTYGNKDGYISESIYEDRDKLIGEQETYFIVSKKYFLNGNLAEEYTTKYEHGIPLLDGAWNSYYENGNIKLSEVYSDNKLLKSTKYSIDGYEQ